MPEIADDEPFSIEVLSGYVIAGRAWVAVEPDSAHTAPGDTGAPDRPRALVGGSSDRFGTLIGDRSDRPGVLVGNRSDRPGPLVGGSTDRPGVLVGGRVAGPSGGPGGPVADPVDGAVDPVMVDLAGRPVGYLIADLVDGNVHVEQVSVDPRFSRRGAGRLLIDRAAAYARQIGAPALTLTTFADVEWNAPYYRRCGFETMDDAAIMPELRAVREHEAAAGLDRWPRVCMRRALQAHSSG
jgi:GNAT superfamily N-acetyltransferase